MERNQIEMPYRVLGRTGAGVSAIGLGGWYLALKTVSAELSTRIVHAAVDRGINFLDNSWDYNSNRSRHRRSSTRRRATRSGWARSLNGCRL